MFFSLLGVLSAIIFFIGDLPYLVDTIKGKTRPHRVSWGIVVLLNFIGFLNQLAIGAGNSLWIFASACFITSAIFIAAVFRGEGGHSRQDILIIAGSLMGVVLWVILNNPMASILANIAVATISLVPTILKTIKDPESETRISWLVATISTFMATISVGELDFQLLLLPGWATILQGIMVYILYFKPKSEVAAGAKTVKAQA